MNTLKTLVLSTVCLLAVTATTFAQVPDAGWKVRGEAMPGHQINTTHQANWRHTQHPHHTHHIFHRHLFHR